MILEEDSYMQFRYDTITHILSVVWPDPAGTTLPEIENSLQKLSRNIKNFDVRKLLSDLRAGFDGLDLDEYKNAIEAYHLSLKDTNLQKIARIMPEDPAWEYFVKNYSSELREKFNLPFKVRFFTNKAEAIAWLQED